MMLLLCKLCYYVSAFGAVAQNSPLLDEVLNDPDSYYRHVVTPATKSEVARNVAHNACEACQQCNNPPRRYIIAT